MSKNSRQGRTGQGGLPCDGQGHEWDENGHEHEDDEEVYVFTDEDGNEHEFLLADVLEVEGKEYAVFLSAEDEEAEEDDGEGSVIAVLRVVGNGDGNADLLPVEDETEFQKVVAAFEAAIEAEAAGAERDG